MLVDEVCADFDDWNVGWARCILEGDSYDRCCKINEVYDYDVSCGYEGVSLTVSDSVLK